MSENTLSEIDTLKLTLSSMGTLDEMMDSLMSRKMADLEVLAEEAGVLKVATNKAAVSEQIIARLTTNTEANIGVEETEIGGEDGDPTPLLVLDDLVSPGPGVLLGESGGGVAIPAKVAAMSPDRLWPEILGWEIDQKLDETAPVYSVDELREYLGYLWLMGSLGRDPKLWARITDYDFRGLA